MALQHGGQLLIIAQQFNIPAEQWLDLSTGIAPYHYPIPVIPSVVWAHLPQTNASLLAAATAYYDCPSVLPVHGSQSVIQRLPELWLSYQQHNVKRDGALSVYLPEEGYKEHEKSWREVGANIYGYKELPIDEPLKRNCVVVLINPNNPTGELTSRSQVLALLKKVKEQQGLLIVDEAFMDTTDGSQSLISYTQDSALIVLRSLGKFFGLAGLRLGFVAACPAWLTRISANQGPWAVSGPAQFVGAKALVDNTWQLQQLARLQLLSVKLSELLKRIFNVSSQGTLLFQTVYLPQAKVVYHKLCLQAVYVRLTDNQLALRFGVPLEQDFSRLERALLAL